MMNRLTTQCPIWNIPVSYELTDGTAIIINSPRTGGRYWISLRALEVVKHRDAPLKSRLTTWLIEQRRLGTDCPRILTGILDEAAQRRSLSIQQRADNLLRYIQKQLPDIGTDFYFETDHHLITDPDSNATRIFWEMLAWSESREIHELRYLLDHLEGSTWLLRIRDLNTRWRFRLTVQGHSHLAEIDHTVKASSQAFVAMWFHESMDRVWEDGILPAINETGYEAIRIDQQEQLDKIDDAIIAAIRRARFLVADFTHGEAGARGGVYYEAGFAHGLNIPVIFSCHKDCLEAVHFDTRQYPHIFWSAPEELRNALAKRISAVISDGPLKT